MPKSDTHIVCQHTLQPYTTNQPKCSSCETVEKKDQVV